MQQIRITRTPELDKVLASLKQKYRLLSEAEIIKAVLSEKYSKELDNAADKEQRVRDAWERLKVEGKKIGIRLMKERGLDPKKVTEQQFHDLFLDDHKHNA